MMMKMIILEVVDGVEKRIMTDTMKGIMDEVVEEAFKEGQFKMWLNEIEENGPTMRYRMDLCLKLKSMEVEKVIRLMIE